MKSLRNLLVEELKQIYKAKMEIEFSDGEFRQVSEHAKNVFVKNMVEFFDCIHLEEMDSEILIEIISRVGFDDMYVKEVLNDVFQKFLSGENLNNMVVKEKQ